MGQPKDIAALEDLIYGVLDPAMESEKGKVLTFPTASAAFSVYMRIRTALKRMREQSREIYPPEDINYNKHGYERLAITRDVNKLYLYVVNPDTVLEKLNATMEDIP